MLSLQKPAGPLGVITLYGWLFSIILTGIMRFKNSRSVYVLAGIIFIVLLMKKCDVKSNEITNKDLVCEDKEKKFRTLFPFVFVFAVVLFCVISWFETSAWLTVTAWSTVAREAEPASTADTCYCPAAAATAATAAIT